MPHIILSHTRADTPLSGTPTIRDTTTLTHTATYFITTLHLLSTDRRADRPKVTLPPRKRLGIALGPRYKVRESSFAPTARPPGGFRVDYGFVSTIYREIKHDLERDVSYRIIDSWDEMLVDMPGAPATDDTELGRRMTEFATRVRQDIDEIYDRHAHARIALLMEREARMSQEAWGRSMDASDLARSEAADRKRQAAITELLTAYCRRQALFIEALKLLKRLQT
ncbi:hypothetical protein Tco_1466569 [Tanacetum coccineum]